MDLFKEHIRNATVAYDKGDYQAAAIHTRRAVKILQQMTNLHKETPPKT